MSLNVGNPGGPLPAYMERKQSPTAAEILAPHSRKSIATALQDDALAHLVLDMMGVKGGFTPESWASLIATWSESRKTVGHLLKQQGGTFVF